ncbi:protein of unknown function [Taphrina deformans PYCC 5710]|uniref:DNA-binding protein REB1 n=1 Tax=Taphrina deformans (strain PYCC 5710 / ATCC 11124 / CBS 356.35 / IMI 108563 / JCM 9778 / NBRC 8474) TaxID=1097556 RepID=R4XM27_TAPDE|nr:protein of unknown function [Taphrina deformans PYCC 5710]|eukprot:CCG84350.1 protein of unknown function [Taphrina deformans PYCC 5710]
MTESDSAKIAAKKARKAQTRALKKANRKEEQARKTGVSASVQGDRIDEVNKRNHEADSSFQEETKMVLPANNEHRAAKKRRIDETQSSNPPLNTTIERSHEEKRHDSSVAEKKAAKKAAKAARKALENSRSVDVIPSSRPPVNTTSRNGNAVSDIPLDNQSPPGSIGKTLVVPDRVHSLASDIDTQSAGQDQQIASDLENESPSDNDSQSTVRKTPRVMTGQAIASTTPSIPLDDSHEGSQHNTNRDEAFSESDPLVPKAQRAVRKYLRRQGIDINDFAAEIMDQPIIEHPFFRFAKTFFASMSRNEFGRLIRQVTSDIQNSGVESSNTLASVETSSQRKEERNDQHKDQNTNGESAGKEKPYERPDGQSAPKTKDIHRSKGNDRQSVNDGHDYRSGPLTDDEKSIIGDAVSAYCSEHNLSNSEFCNIVWDLPRPLPVAEKRRFLSEFLHLLPDRKTRNVRDWFKRAYIPYDRSPFTEEEDEELLRLHSIHGADWKLISNKMARFREDVRDRYRNHLATKPVMLGEWSAEENEKFLGILQRYKNRSEMHWGEIARQMESRSRPQCRDRYLRMQGERTKSISRLRRALRDPSTSGTDTSEREKSSVKVRPKIMAGDVLALAKLIKANRVTSITEALERELFQRDGYSSVFGDDNIHIKMKSELDQTGTGRFVTKLDRLIEKYEALDESELLSTLVKD